MRESMEPLKRAGGQMLNILPSSQPFFWLLVSNSCTCMPLGCLKMTQSRLGLRWDLGQLWKTESFFNVIIRGLHWCMFSFAGICWARQFTSLNRKVMLCCDWYLLIEEWMKSLALFFFFFAKHLRVHRERFSFLTDYTMFCFNSIYTLILVVKTSWNHSYV